MSDTSFPMPKTLAARDNGYPDTPRETVVATPQTPYAKRSNLEAVADAIDMGYKAPSTPPRPPSGDYKTPGHTAVIKEKLKALTHREMREFVAEIFEARKKLGEQTGNEAITRTEMPDVLDRLAYGD
jgi:hypothetical protein